jgi:hypothetical protein
MRLDRAAVPSRLRQSDLGLGPTLEIITLVIRHLSHEIPIVSDRV